MKKINIFFILLIVIILSKIFNFYDKLRAQVLKIENPFNIARLYKGIIKKTDISVDYIENPYYLTCLEEGVVSYIGYNNEYKNFIVVSSVDNTYLYYNLDIIDISLYEYLDKNEIISIKEGTGVKRID